MGFSAQVPTIIVVSSKKKTVREIINKIKHISINLVHKGLKLRPSPPNVPILPYIMIVGEI